MTMKSGLARKQIIVSCLLPKKAHENAEVNVIKEDQGRDIYYYFEFNGKTFALRIDGDAELDPNKRK